MKIIIDNKIPYIEGALEPFAEVVYLPGSETTATIVRDADALITRTRTRCSAEILQGSKVRYIATATIGFDHIDVDYCKQNEIRWSNAPGCNAESVNQYIAAALFSYSQRNEYALKGKTIGIVGVGQVGSRVAKTCEILGMNVLLNDPPRERLEGSSQFVSLKTIQRESDIITFHVPLNMEGVDRTYHMADAAFVRGLAKQPIMINTCRGEVFDTSAVKNAIGTASIAGAIIDCWENEPGVDPGLMEQADFVTPHIAGYSRDGKANGTTTSVRALSRFFGLGIDQWKPRGVEGPENPVIELDGAGRSDHEVIARAVLATYKITEDDRTLKADPSLFEQLRGDYPVRREFDYWSVKAVNTKENVLDKLQKLGFRILEENT
jgi:erythronate-4-phosphate dehydrogenase